MENGTLSLTGLERKLELNRARSMGNGKPGKSWNFRISFSRPGKSWNLSVGHGKLCLLKSTK